MATIREIISLPCPFNEENGQKRSSCGSKFLQIARIQCAHSMIYGLCKFCKRKDSPYMKACIYSCMWLLYSLFQRFLSHVERAADRMPNIITGFQDRASRSPFFIFCFSCFAHFGRNTPPPPPPFCNFAVNLFDLQCDLQLE